MHKGQERFTVHYFRGFLFCVASVIRPSVKAGPEGKGPPTSEEEEEEEGGKMQANPAYLPIEMSYKSQESKYINVSS